jgi:putative (di)nucleoside polyphosphate hydrolase
MSLIVTCGVVLANRRGEVFACHATGTPRWDLPKGVGEAGESPRTTAVREAWEESGLRIPEESLSDLGEFRYLPAKRLHLFALRVADDAFDPFRCTCRSFFEHHRTHRRLPEADAWGWKPRGTPWAWCGKNMARVLSTLEWTAIDGLPEVAAIEVDVDS